MSSSQLLSSDEADSTTGNSEKISHQFDNVIVDLRNRTHVSDGVDYDDAFKFWKQQRSPTWQKTSFRAQPHRLTLKGSFSVCGMLSAGRRHRMNKSMQIRAGLKLNSKVLANTGFNF